jgi:hypothetical protein
MAGDAGGYTCAACGTQVEQSRWLGWSRDRFLFGRVGSAYRNAKADLLARPFTKAQLADLAGSCYTDADLAAIAAGDLTRLRLPRSTVAQIMFPQTHETCYIQINSLLRAEGAPLPDGVSRVNAPADRRTLKILDQGNLFISDQRLIFPSSTHTTIRLDRKLSGACTFRDALAVQRKGEDLATYFLGLESRSAALIVAYLQGRLDHLR